MLDDAPPLALGTRNRLLGELDPGDAGLLRPHLERVPFVVGDVLAEAGDAIGIVCFPEQGITGVLDALGDDRHYAVGLVGSEGFLGWPLLLGETRSPYRLVMRAEEGSALRMPAAAFLAAVEASATLRRHLLGFVQSLMVQMGRTIVSSLAHPIERRMARWILLYHDRVRGDDICMTHEEFRLMLGVRRSSVTDALHRLEEVRAVRATRGRIVVRDRSVLEALAGDTYGPAEDAYRRLLGRGG